jgi:hypothetical protein
VKFTGILEKFIDDEILIEELNIRGYGKSSDPVIQYLITNHIMFLSSVRSLNEVKLKLDFYRLMEHYSVRMLLGEDDQFYELVDVISDGTCTLYFQNSKQKFWYGLKKTRSITLRCDSKVHLIDFVGWKGIFGDGV